MRPNRRTGLFATPEMSSVADLLAQGRIGLSCERQA
jgi:hypothetical protein